MDILISDPIDFKTKIVTREKGKHFPVKKRSGHQEDITIISIYARSKRALKIQKAKTNIHKGKNR